MFSLRQEICYKYTTTYLCIYSVAVAGRLTNCIILNNKIACDCEIICIHNGMQLGFCPGLSTTRTHVT